MSTGLASHIVIHRPDRGEAGVCSGCVQDLEGRLAHFLASKGLDEPDLLSSQIPLVDWVVSDSVPGTVSLTLLCYERPSSGLHNFFHELVSRYLRPSAQVPILSSRALTFSFEGRPDVLFYFGEMIVPVAREGERREMVLQIPRVTQDLKRGAACPERSDQILEERGLTADQKMTHSKRRVLRFFERFKVPYLEEVAAQQGWWRMSIPDGSLKGRSLGHLSWLLASLVLTHQHVRRETYLFPEQRGVKVALRPVQLRYPFGTKEALAIVVAIRAEKGVERIEEAHLLEAACEIVPHLKGVEGSFFSYETPGDQVRLLYLEVEGLRPGRLPTSDIVRLKRELGGELKDHVQKLTPSLFTQRNEEEVLRTLLTLAKELRYVGDPPQVVISYQEMTGDVLIFSVICVRLLKGNSLPMPEVFAHLPLSWRCQLEHERSVGTLRKKYPKSASVFTVTVGKGPFLRKDHAVDLHQARSHIVEGLMGAFGVLRDYNGGLMVKQNEVLSATKTLLGQTAKKREDLLEALFYSLSPAVMQSYLSPDLLGALFRLLLEMLKVAPDLQEGYNVKVRSEAAGTIVLIRGERPAFKEEVIGAVSRACPDPLSWSHAFVEVGSACCLALLFLGGDLQVAAEMEKRAVDAMRKWVRRHRNRQVVSLYVEEAAGSLDPRVGVDRRSGIMIKMLYEGLMRLGEEGKPRPAIARQIDTSYDQRVYTFWLRPSRWSDGTPLTAHDFEYAWKKAIDPAFASRHAYLFFPIKNARLVRSGKLPIDAVGVRAEGADKLVVELENPIPYFLDYVTHWSYSPVPKDIDDRAPGWAHERGSAYVCNGPFKLEKGEAGEELFLVKNPHYWDAGAVSLSEIHLVRTESLDTALAMFDQGQLDWIGEPLCGMPGVARGRGEGKIIPAGGICSLDINVGQVPFTSKKMRQAFAYAIDRGGLAKEVLRGRGEPALSLVPQGMKAALSPPFPDGDLEIARRLFEEGLAELKMTRGEIGPILLSHPILDDQPDVAHFVASCWEKAFDIRVLCDAWPWRSYLGHLYDSVVHVAAKTWYSWIDDPIYSLEPYQYADNTFNGPRWEDPTYTRLLSEAEALADPTLRMEKLAQAEAILVDEMPAIPLYHVQYHYLVSPKLHRVNVTSIGQIDFKTSYIGEAEPAVEEEAKKRLCRINVRTEPTALDPRVGADSSSVTVVKMLFEGLMHIGPDGNPAPGLACDIEIGADQTLYTFTLRSSTWTDGEPVTAYDFEYAWKGALNPAFSTAYDYAFFVLYNGRKARKGEVSLDEVGVRAMGPDKLCVRLEHPVPYFLELVANPVYSPVPHHLIKSEGEWYQRPSSFVSNGPFRLADWDKGRQMGLRKNPQYWDAESVHLDGIELYMGTNARMNLYGFESGEIDWAGQPLSDLPADQIRSLAGREEMHIESIACLFRLDINCQRPPFSCIKMRRAFEAAIDRKAMEEEVLSGKEKITSSLLPLHLSLDDEEEVVACDLDKARLLFEESLALQGLTRTDISPLVFTYPLAERYRVMAQFLQRRWQEAFDVPILLEGCEWGAYLKKRRAGEYQLANILWYSWINDPTYNLMAYRERHHFYNLCHWEHSDYARVIDAVRAAATEAERLALLRKAERFIRQEVPSVPLYVADYKYLKNKSLQGVFISSLGWIDFRWAKFEEEKS